MSNQKAASTWASLQAQQAMPHSTKKNDYVLLDYMDLEYGSKSIGNWVFLKKINIS